MPATPSSRRRSTDLSSEERTALLDEIYSDDPLIRESVVKKLLSIICDRMDYLSVAGDLLTEIELDVGVIPAIERDIHGTVLTAIDITSYKENFDKSNTRVFFDEFQVESLVTARIPEVLQRSYAIIDRFFEAAPRDMAEQFDRLLFMMLNHKYTVSLFQRVKFFLTPAQRLTTELIQHYGLKVRDIGTILVPSDVFRFYEKELVSFTNNYPNVTLRRVDNYIIESNCIYFVPRHLGYLALRKRFGVYDAAAFTKADVRFAWLFYSLIGMVMTNLNTIKVKIKL